MLTSRTFALTAIAGLLALAVTGCSASSTNTPADADDQQPTTTKGQSKREPAGIVLLSVRGSGTKTTEKFSAAKDWDLRWSYDCAKSGSQGNFIVTVSADDPLSQTAMLVGVNQFGARGAGVEHFHVGGNGIWLEVNSECSWTIKAVAA